MRLRKLVQQADAAQPGIDQAGPADAMDCWRILRGRRILKTEQFISNPQTSLHLLGVIVGSVPLDMLFNTFFDAEAYAKERAPTDPIVGLLEAMADKEGILHDVHVGLAAPVLEEPSAFDFVEPLCATLNINPGSSAVNFAPCNCVSVAVSTFASSLCFGRTLTGSSACWTWTSHTKRDSSKDCSVRATVQVATVPSSLGCVLVC